jgi:hypothetical protein
MLGRLQMTVAECIAQYDNVMKEVFPETGDIKKAFNLATHGEFYDSTNLENIIKKLIKDKLGDSDVDLLDEKGPCNMYVFLKLQVVLALVNALTPWKHVKFPDGYQLPGCE